MANKTKPVKAEKSKNPVKENQGVINDHMKAAMQREIVKHLEQVNSKYPCYCSVKVQANNLLAKNIQTK